MKRIFKVTCFLLGILFVFSFNSYPVISESPDDDIIHVDHHLLEKYGIDNSTIPDFDLDQSVDEKTDFQELEIIDKSEGDIPAEKSDSDKLSESISKDSNSKEGESKDSQDSKVKESLADNEKEKSSTSEELSLKLDSNSLGTTPEWLIVILLGFMITFAYKKSKF
ncbi:MAG: hypothetical protein ACW981_12230 [Candidatus Hodarchaeales archaeon]|jgi:hypothetical protein